MHTNPSQVLSVDELLAADLLFGELLSERDTQSPLIDLATRAEFVNRRIARAVAVAEAS